MMTVLVAGQDDVGDRAKTRGFRVEFARDRHAAMLCFPQHAAGTPFQDHRWLAPWFAAFGDPDRAEPLIAIVRDAATAEIAALVPLVRQRRQGIRIVTFADLDMTDYNMPVLGKAGPRDEAESKAFCRALVKALRRAPGGADLLRLQKMPAVAGGLRNPLIALGREGSSSLNGNLIEVGDSYEDYLHSIRRIQMPRHWRVFSRYPGARFEVVNDVDRARALLDTMDAHQKARMASLHRPFSLDSDPPARFYRDLVGRSLQDGFAVVTMLACDEGIVAAVLGIRRDDHFVFLRITNAGRRWSHCSPSRLLTERTMAAMHARGVRTFDLSIGNYAYKRRFGAQRLPLTDASAALSWKGLPHALRDRTIRTLRSHPRLYGWLEQLSGRSKPREE